MDALRGLLIAMAGTALLAAAAEHLLPPGRSRQIALFSVGLVMLMTMVSPLVRLMGRVPEDIAAAEAFRMDEALVRQERQAVEEDYRRQVLEVWQRRIESAAVALAEEYGANAPSAKAELDERGVILSVTVYGAPASSEFRGALVGRLDIEEARIVLVR